MVRITRTRYTAATSFASHSFNIWTFLHVSTRQRPGSPWLRNGCTAVGRDVGFNRSAKLAIKQPGSQSGWLRDLEHFARATVSLPDPWRRSRRPVDWTTDSSALHSVSLTESRPLVTSDRNSILFNWFDVNRSINLTKICAPSIRLLVSRVVPSYFE